MAVREKKNINTGKADELWATCSVTGWMELAFSMIVEERRTKQVKEQKQSEGEREKESIG